MKSIASVILGADGEYMSESLVFVHQSKLRRIMSIRHLLVFSFQPPMPTFASRKRLESQVS